MTCDCLKYKTKSLCSHVEQVTALGCTRQDCFLAFPPGLALAV